MAVRTLEELRSRFQTRDYPDGADFVDLIDTLDSLQPLSVTEGHLANESVATRSIIPGSAFQHLRTTPSLGVEWYNDSAQEVLIQQPAHGFLVNDVVAIGLLGNYVRARANTAATAQPVGVVTWTNGAELFTLATAGVVTLNGNSLSTGKVYYVDPDNAGRLTAARPESAGMFVAPVLVATSSVTGVLVIRDATMNVTPPLNFAPIFFDSPRVITSPPLGSSNWHTIDLAAIADVDTTFRYAILSIRGDSSGGSLNLYVASTLMRSAEAAGQVRGTGAVVHTCGCASGAIASSTSVFMFPTYTEGTSSSVDVNVYPAGATNTILYAIHNMRLLGYVV